MGKAISLQNLRRQYELEPQKTVHHLMEAIDTGKIKPDEISLRDTFVAFHPHGKDLLYEISFNKGRGQQAALQEAQQFVSTGDFSNITGQIIYNMVRAGYNDPVFLWPQLCATVMTEFLNGERIPGIGAWGDKLERVEENMRYPEIGLNEEFTDTKPTVKFGAIMSVSREIIIADRTGVLLTMANGGGRAAGIKKEKEVQNLATGQVNNYNRNGVSTNTYLTSGAYINSQTGNALDTSGNEWRALEKSDLLWDAMTDPNTGEPIGVPAQIQLLVPTALARSAERIVNATEIQTVDMRANASTIRTTSGNPYANRKPQILTNQYVKNATSSSTQWFVGDFKAAIKYMSVWEIETQQAGNNNEVEFTQDVWARYKVSYRGVAQMYEPRFLIKNDA